MEMKLDDLLGVFEYITDNYGEFESLVTQERTGGGIQTVRL